MRTATNSALVNVIIEWLVGVKPAEMAQAGGPRLAGWLGARFELGADGSVGPSVSWIL